MRCHLVVTDSELERKGSGAFPQGIRKGVGDEEAQAWLLKSREMEDSGS